MKSASKLLVGDRALVITRTFNAPRELVWKAWTEPERIMRWWGPKPFTSPSCTLDVQFGGKYLLAMRSPDGKDFWNTGVYTDIQENRRLTFTNCFSDENGKIVSASYYGMDPDVALEMVTSIEFADEAGKTKLTIRHTGLPEGEMSKNTKLGWESSLEKLEESLH